jgi:hypothetical protein
MPGCDSGKRVLDRLLQYVGEKRPISIRLPSDRGTRRVTEPGPVDRNRRELGGEALL